MDFLTLPVIGKPLWMWAGFVLAVVALLAFDLGVLHRKTCVSACKSDPHLGDIGVQK